MEIKKIKYKAMIECSVIWDSTLSIKRPGKEMTSSDKMFLYGIAYSIGPHIEFACTF